MSDDDETRTPLDHALDVFVYLPVGLVFELPRSIPRFIDRGRRQVDQACAIGLEALHLGGRASSDPVQRVRDHTAATLRGLGVAPPLGDEPAPRPGAPTLSVVGDPAPVPTRPSTNGSSGSVAPAAPSGPPPDPSTLAIPGYDSLSASQVVPRLEGLTTDELETVRTYEQSTRGRKTILSKIAQLQAS